MAITVYKTFASGEILTAADLNSSFSQIVNNGADLVFPITEAADFDGFEVILDADQDTSITADTDDQIDFKLSGTDYFRMTAGRFMAVAASIVEAEGAAVASSDTTNIWANDGNTLHITGTTAITIIPTGAPLASATKTAPLSMHAEIIASMDSGDISPNEARFAAAMNDAHIRWAAGRSSVVALRITALISRTTARRSQTPRSALPPSPPQYAGIARRPP